MIGPTSPMPSVPEGPLRVAPAEVRSEWLTTNKLRVWGTKSAHSLALYEWGIFGLGLLCVFLIATVAGFARKMASEGGGSALAFLGVLPSIVLGLAIENVLAGAPSAAGVGILLAMSFAWKMEPSWSSDLLAAEDLSSESPLFPA
jgi:hypothetical protein